MRLFAREWVKKYPSIARMYEAIAGTRRMGSPDTVANYVKGVKKFCAFVEVDNPEILLQKLLSGDIDPGKEVDDFITYALEEKKWAHGHVRNLVFGIKKWFDLSGVQVDWNRIEMPTSTEIREEDRSPEKDELKRALDHASGARDRAVIYCDTASGLRIGTLLSLKIGDVDFNYPDIARFTVERKRGRKFSTSRSGSQGRLFCTFITPEAKTALQQYLKEREAAGEKLTPESPLFGDAYHKGGSIGTEDYEKVWARLLRRAGLSQKSHLWFVLHIHTLRKYFRSNCIGVDASYRERWMGHKGLYLDMSYFKAEEQLHVNEYRKAVPHLTIYTAAEADLRKQEAKSAKAAFITSEKAGKLTPEQVTEHLKRIDEIYARAKDSEEALEGFRRFVLGEEEEETKKAKTQHDGNGRYLVAHSEDEMIQKLHEGYSLVQSLNHDKYLLETQCLETRGS